MIAARTNPTEFEFEFRIFTRAAAFQDHGCSLVASVLALQRRVDPLKAKPECDLVRI